MEIHIGIQPNCSELVVYIDGHSDEEIFDRMEKHGISYCYVKDFYKYGDDKEPAQKWDGAQPRDSVVPLSTLKVRIRNKLRKYFETSLMKDEEMKKVIKDLEDQGFELHKASLQLVDKDNIHDRNGYPPSVNFYPDHDGHKAIVGHQHCTTSMFPTLKKISDMFDEEVLAYDGGSLCYYESWLDAGCPDPKTWNPDEEVSDE